jgi:hypothetical protein
MLLPPPPLSFPTFLVTLSNLAHVDKHRSFLLYTSSPTKMFVCHRHIIFQVEEEGLGEEREEEMGKGEGERRGNGKESGRVGKGREGGEGGEREGGMREGMGGERRKEWEGVEEI